MAYEPNEWVSGETRVTADRMNHIERGVAEAHAAAEKAAERPRGFTVSKKAWEDVLARLSALEG